MQKYYLKSFSVVLIKNNATNITLKEGDRGHIKKLLGSSAFCFDFLILNPPEQQNIILRIIIFIFTAHPFCYC